MKMIAILLCISRLTASSFEFYPVDLKKKDVLSGKCSILLPTNFLPMDAETLTVKYPSAGHRPTEVYTNEKATINVALNHTSNKAKEGDLIDVKKAMEIQFSRPPFMLIKSELSSINGSQLLTLEFVSPAIDAKIYNLMAIGRLEGRLVMITFNCTEAERTEWEPIGKRIISSIGLKN